MFAQEDDAMGALATALENLGALDVPGVTVYPLDETPNALTRAQLPALVILPELAGEGSGLEPNQFSAGDGRLDVRIAHVLLAEPVAAGYGLRGGLPALVGLIDATMAALAADPILGGALAVALRCAVRAGVVRYAGVDYHAATFLHTWTLDVP
ncbi:hypothetical protein [Aggregatilinea lenta]|uniref:hypothetical protein n=1 Tax=Aggregatilinea lenta TaxID=913108 RepID=UPI0013C2DE23|nr:hypothetical protein [Aggregatilinea lenta]